MSPSRLKEYTGKYIIKVSQDFFNLQPFFCKDPVRVGHGPSRIVKYGGVYVLVRPLVEEDFENYNFIKSLISNWTIKVLDDFVENSEIIHQF